MNVENLTYKKIFVFWIPLAATWLMMSVEGPFLAAVIARMAEPKFNLAAYGIAFSIGLVVESPIMMVLSASVALVKSSDSFIKLRNFTYMLNTSITAIMLIIVYPPLFRFLAEDLINLPPNVAHLAHISSIILMPWPAAIGYRRFYQGVLIAHDLTRRVGYGTVIRLLTIAAVSLTLFFMTDLPGTYVATAALSIAVTVEGITSRLMAGKIVAGYMTEYRRRHHAGKPEETLLTYRYITRFYFPLAMSSVMALSIRPIVNFFVGHSRQPLESLAVLPVIGSLTFIFACFGLSYQEVGIALLGKRMQGYIKLRNFAFVMSVILEISILLMAFTPLSYVWFHDVSGLSLELTEFAIFPFQITVLLPALTILLAFQRSLLVNEKNTRPITIATLVEVTGIAIAMVIGVRYVNATGAIAATVSMVLGRVIANGYLMPHWRRSLKRYLFFA